MNSESHYENDRVAEFIHRHGFTRVALQFPDELLKDSMRVVKSLREKLNSLYVEDVKLYVMADTTYGSCCVDEVGASHVNANCVIHYGHTCLSQTSTLPALFIFGKASISVSKCVTNLRNCGERIGKPILVLYGLEYAHAIQEIKEALISDVLSLCGSTSGLEPLYADIRCSVIYPPETSNSANRLELVDREVANSLAKGTNTAYGIGGLTWSLPEGRKMDDYLVFWIGLDNPAFANVVLQFNSCEIVRYDATEDCLVTNLSQQKKILNRRYYLVEKAKDANIIGILVGTLGVAGYLNMIHRIKEMITRAGKKAYTFVMGRPNPAKLANFPECDVFVFVSCAQTALLDSKEFLAPVITPFEAMVALSRGSQWTGEYVIEFSDLIASCSFEVKKQSEEARFSFLKGGYVENLDPEDDDAVEKDEILALVNVTEKALRVRDNNSLSIKKANAKSGAEYFATRSYHGLEINGDNRSPETFLIGRSGRASGYDDEKTKQGTL
ncbi:diphthamide synthesis DPH2 family protein [Forsythia ovata]|uniref:2-(3-amino-3-carboxypropyl)histidine synthase subunit 2 n=1 Tax=Forsythia ovata TaxID=205694 RepID=A0ABD1X4P5_9LAMI